jgi:hypothetical protein
MACLEDEWSGDIVGGCGRCVVGGEKSMQSWQCVVGDGLDIVGGIVEYRGESCEVVAVGWTEGEPLWEEEGVGMNEGRTVRKGC